MNDHHWYPRNPVKYLTDTAWCDCATECAHNRLIDTYYALGTAIHDNREEIQNIGKIKDADYVRVRGNLQRLGWRFEGGLLRHKMIEETLADMDKVSVERREAGKKGAAARWQNDSKQDGKAIAEPLANGMAKQCTDTVTVTVTNTETDINDKASAAAPPVHSPTKTTKPKKLSNRQKKIADTLESAMGQEWTNDAGKWITRIKSNTAKAERVAAELSNAIKESRIGTTPARYAEDTWKRFA